MNILILGGNGYVGSSLFKKLSPVYNVVIATRNDFSMTDSRSMTEWFSEKYFDVVINATAVGGSRLQKDDQSILDQNLRMHYNLMANRDHYSRIISFGSGAEVFAPETPYGMSKRIITQSMMLDPKAFVIRIFAVFDENELPTRFIKGNLLRYINKQPMIVHSNKVMDFYYMNDLANLVKLYLMETDLPKIVDCSYEKKYSLVQIAEFINSIDTHTVPIVVEDTSNSENYCGIPHGCNIKETGLCVGIKETYKRLKQ